MGVCLTVNATPSTATPVTIDVLIARRLSELEMTTSELLQRCGYTNLNKGRRRLAELVEGETVKTRMLVDGLPRVLGLSPEEVRASIEASRKVESVPEKLFKPHGIIVTERSVPSPIFVAAVFGIDRILRIDFATESSPVTFVDQAVKGVQARLKEFKCECLPAFGRPTGVVVNYAPDQATVFDLEGNAREVLSAACAPGQVTMSIGGKRVDLPSLLSP
jgi:hypothetical protein